MDINDKLLDAHKTVSRINVVLLVAISFFCIYLVQRAFSVLSYTPELLLVKSAKQFSFLGLELSYRTLTYLWPLFLGSLCLTFSFLTSKQLLILSILRQGHPILSMDQLSSLDPFLITPDRMKFKTGRFIYKIIALAPVIATFWHFCSVIVSFFVFSFSPRFGVLFTSSGPRILFSFLGLSLSSIFGLWSALRYREAMEKIKLTYDSYDEKQCKT